MRLDLALIADARLALRSVPIRLYLVLQLAAGIVFVWRRGSETASTVVLIWLAMLVLMFVAWWAGRDARAHPAADPVDSAAARTTFALLAATGLLLHGVGIDALVWVTLLACGIGGWLWSAYRARSWHGLLDRLRRSPRPFVPLLVLVGLPNLLLTGPAYVLDVALALPSGVGQQLLYLLGLFAPAEALVRRTDVAAVAAATVFALIHLPLVMEANDQDLLAGLANVVLFQASVGLAACLAFVRHRAALPIGIAHALAIA